MGHAHRGRRHLPRARALAAILWLAGLGGAACGPGGAPSAPAVADDAALAPEFTLEDVRGASHSLAASAGRVRLIDFWATWCPPCRAEIPLLKQLDAQYRDQGLTILAISDEDPAVLRQFVEEQGIEYPNLVDPGDVSERYSVLGLPTGFLVDREGRIVERFFGAKPHDLLERRIRELLAAPVPAARAQAG